MSVRQRVDQARDIDGCPAKENTVLRLVAFISRDDLDEITEEQSDKIMDGLIELVESLEMHTFAIMYPLKEGGEKP